MKTKKASTRQQRDADRAAATLADVAEFCRAKHETALAAQRAREPKRFSLLTYRVSSDLRPFWSETIQAESHYEATLAASEKFGIPFKNVDCTIS